MSGFYATAQGDTWDMIAYRKLGSTDYTDQLVSANLKHAGTLLFPAGVTLRLPEIEEKPNTNLPPWKR
ncbi:phage tail protein [Pseudoflavonifractor sp. 524-17]|uniref:tail protein X n=1 Tax=Pseudoflavonifractor sp. 524-17 TaxID=2304577 RepID=UPI00137A168D|nr:tail protein X [Pseudoflavonifractor sp. 524-17]NCE63019.1 phage tail protein [Pseudoflavonifractor sp. 524-17]